jgi:hypothetical protein
MKNVLKKLVLALIILPSIFISCNKDEARETVTSDVENLLSRISMKNTQEEDSMSDSCFDLVYQVSGTLNGTTHTFNNMYDILTFAALAEQNNWNLNNFKFAFPIKVVFYDYTQRIVNNQTQLEELSIACSDSDVKEAVNCFDFVYPITLSVYNTSNQNTTQVVVNSDEQLYNYLKNNGNNTMINLSYPVSIKKIDGTVVQVNNDSQLKTWSEECE